MSPKTSVDASTSYAEKNGVIGGSPLGMWSLTVKTVIVLLVDVFAVFKDLPLELCGVGCHSEGSESVCTAVAKACVGWEDQCATDATIAHSM